MLTGSTWRSITFTDLYYKHCDYKQNKNKGKTIKPSTCLEKKAIYEFLVLCKYDRIMLSRKMNFKDIWSKTKLVTTDISSKKNENLPILQQQRLKKLHLRKKIILTK